MKSKLDLFSLNFEVSVVSESIFLDYEEKAAVAIVFTADTTATNALQ